VESATSVLLLLDNLAKICLIADVIVISSNRTAAGRSRPLRPGGLSRLASAQQTHNELKGSKVVHDDD
jgi:hypothetical protein